MTELKRALSPETMLLLGSHSAAVFLWCSNFASSTSHWLRNWPSLRETVHCVYWSANWSPPAASATRLERKRVPRLVRTSGCQICSILSFPRLNYINLQVIYFYLQFPLASASVNNYNYHVSGKPQKDWRRLSSWGCKLSTQHFNCPLFLNSFNLQINNKNDETTPLTQPEDNAENNTANETSGLEEKLSLEKDAEAGQTSKRKSITAAIIAAEDILENPKIRLILAVVCAILLFMLVLVVAIILIANLSVRLSTQCHAAVLLTSTCFTFRMMTQRIDSCASCPGREGNTI